MTFQKLFALVFIAAQSLLATSANAQSADELTCAKAPSTEALKACTSVIATGGDTIVLARAHFNRGISQEAKGRLRQAIQDYTDAIKLNPQYSPPYNNRALLYSRQGKKKLALRDFDRSIEIDSTNFYALNSRGRFYLVDRADPKRAIEDFDRAIAVNSGFAVSYANRGFAHEILRNKQAAIADLEKALVLGTTEQQRQIIVRSLKKLKK